MTPRDNDELTDIPQMKPAHDEVAGRRSTGAGYGAVRSRNEHPATSGGSNLPTVFALLVAIAALGASYFLWEQSRQTQLAAEAAEVRIAELESQLLSTGDELSQSDAAVRVKLKELDSEVRKLWDSRKKANGVATEQGKSIKSLTASGSATRKQAESLASQLTAVSAELDEVVDMLDAADFENQSARLNQSVERLQRLGTEITEIRSRVDANEEWIDSINAFRRQVNERLNPAVSNTPAQPQLR